VSLILDYPIRCAGQMPQYPPFGGVGFFFGCASEITKALLVCTPYWILPMALAVFALVKALRIQSMTWRVSLALGYLLLPPFILASADIFEAWEQQILRA
jgi:hypothetical protein